jgi:hypothetical protein
VRAGTIVRAQRADAVVRRPLNFTVRNPYRRLMSAATEWLRSNPWVTSAPITFDAGSSDGRTIGACGQRLRSLPPVLAVRPQLRS